MFLADVKNRKKVKILSIFNEDSLKRRLYDLGFFPNSIVECILVSPFSSPILYKVNGALIALRKSDASLIEVEYEN